MNDLLEEYDVVFVLGIPALFSNGRINGSELPEGLYCYDLRGKDDDPGDPCTIEHHVTVNHAGCIITAKPIDIPKCGYVDLGEGLDFADESMTVTQFKAKAQKMEDVYNAN